MIKYKGTTIFPKAIYDILDSFVEIDLYKIHINKDELGNDDITVILNNEIKDSLNIKFLEEKCKSKLKAIPNFTFTESSELYNLIHKKHLRKPLKIEFI